MGKNSGYFLVYCLTKSLVGIQRYHHFTYAAANHCCQSLSERLLHFSTTFLTNFDTFSFQERSKSLLSVAPFCEFVYKQIGTLLT